VNIDRVADAAAALREAVTAAGEPLTLDELYRLGSVLGDVCGRLVGVLEAADKEVRGLPDRFVLRDDEGKDPDDRIVVARADLGEVDEHVKKAWRAARRYHAAIGHIGAEVDPDAAVER